MGFPESTLAAGRAGFSELRHVAVTGSTNRDLADGSRAGEFDPVVLVTDHQTAGRGRLGRDWHDAGGSLLVSFRFEATAATAHRVVAAVAASSRRALAGFMRDDPMFKWPNDLVVLREGAPHKLAGVLAEWIDTARPVVVVGVGINIDPVATDQPSWSVAESGGTVDADHLLATIIHGIPPRLRNPALVLEEMLAHHATIGSRVGVQLTGGGTLVGMATALGPDGHLVVVDDTGDRHEVSTGDVTSLRPPGFV